MKIANHAVVTGGSSGIGLALAKILAQRGANVTVMARRPELLEAGRKEIAAACASANQKINALAVDVSDKAVVLRSFAEAEKLAGPCDLLITSAGIAHPGYFEEIPEELFERTMAVNYFGTLYAIQAVVPQMRKLGRGHVALVSSGAGIVGLFGYTAYSPSKFALRGLAEALRPELARHGIAVSITYPPDTDTPQLEMERLTKPAETKAIAAGAKTWSADGVARVMIAGIENHRFIIVPGWEMRWLFRLHSILAPVFNWHFDHVANKARG